jgi:DNA-binding transcriptional regulator YhcF (GntR family)
MSPLDFSELVNDIRENGVQQSITVFEDMVLDGWHRYLACQQIGCECPSAPFTGKDPVRFVLSLNLNRRHLTGSQKAEAVVACNAWAPSGRPKGEAASPFPTVKTMAEEAGVSERTIQKAKKAHAAGLGEAVKAGKVSVEKAAEIADLPESEREAAISAPLPKKAKPAEPTAERIKELEALLAEREDECRELISEAAAGNDEYQSMLRIIEADDRLAQAHAEVKRFTELNRVLQERLNGKMAECNGLAKDAKRWMNKFLVLERKFKALDRDETFQEGD